MSRGYLITGTDTNVGKTTVTAAWACELAKTGQKVGVYKPVASGCAINPCGQLISDDAQQLWEAAGRPLSLSQVCPQRFIAPLAPYLAAQAEGRAIDDALLMQGLDVWRTWADVTLVEGAGGLFSPLTEHSTVLDYASQVNWPIIIVAVNRIGVIHQVLATLTAARAKAPELTIAGVILNRTTAISAEQDPSLFSNRTELAKWINVPILGELVHGAEQIEWTSQLLV
jgi:dethiobiotin synthetase